MHGHRDLKKYYDFVTGKVLNDILQSENIKKKSIWKKKRYQKINESLYTLYQIYNVDRQRVIN